MKKLYPILFLLALVNCTSTSTQKEVQREKPIKEISKGHIMCITLYNPVCGEDGKTYSNSCNAEVAGVKYTQGECLPKK